MVQYHPNVDRAFAALADPTRRAVLERLGSGRATISELAEPFGMSLTGMKKHIRLLEEAELVTTEKVGRVRRCMLAPYAFEGISTWLQRLDRFAQVVERTKGAPMSPAKKEGFTAEEKAAMKARAKELKANEDGETAMREVIAKMAPKDRAIAKRVHELVKAAAPDLTPKTWYGMPAYANKDGKVVCYFRDAGKFKERYSMLGFNDSAELDAGAMWPVAFALPKLVAADEAKIRALVKKAVG